MSVLSEEINEQIQALCAKGDRMAEAKRYAGALKSYWAAWDLLPDPKTDWDAATWILAAVGDSNFLDGDYVAGRDNLSHAMHCPDAIGNPFLHLRLGQCQFELQTFDRAADELMRAYMGAGPDIFEDEDPKYIRFLQSKAAGIEAPKKAGQF
jgi:tetratricopeptide (TPR) repeat protein